MVHLVVAHAQSGLGRTCLPLVSRIDTIEHFGTRRGCDPRDRRPSAFTPRKDACILLVNQSIDQRTGVTTVYVKQKWRKQLRQSKSQCDDKQML